MKSLVIAAALALSAGSALAAPTTFDLADASLQRIQWGCAVQTSKQFNVTEGALWSRSLIGSPEQDVYDQCVADTVEKARDEGNDLIHTLY